MRIERVKEGDDVQAALRRLENRGVGLSIAAHLMARWRQIVGIVHVNWDRRQPAQRRRLPAGTSPVRVPVGQADVRPRGPVTAY